MERASCRGMAPKKRGDPDPFFPEKGQSELGNEAIRTCFGCQVRIECDEYKKATRSQYGIWDASYSKRGKA